MITLEIACAGVLSALAAEQGGAHRVELCDNLIEGGTTPSYGMILMTRKLITIDLYVIIRPRGGDFYYSDIEFEVMQHDIKQCKALGVNGVVIGMLLQNGQIDIARTAQLKALAYPMDVTFHRAFDRCHDLSIALETLIQLGIRRVLTSGGYPHAEQGLLILKQLVDQAKGRISIMPGSGIRATNIQHIINTLGIHEIHSSAKEFVPSHMHYFNPTIAGSENLSVELSTVKTVKHLIRALHHKKSVS